MRNRIDTELIQNYVFDETQVSAQEPFHRNITSFTVTPKTVWLNWRNDHCLWKPILNRQSAAAHTFHSRNRKSRAQIDLISHLCTRASSTPPTLSMTVVVLIASRRRTDTCWYRSGARDTVRGPSLWFRTCRRYGLTARLYTWYHQYLPHNMYAASPSAVFLCREFPHETNGLFTTSSPLTSLLHHIPQAHPPSCKTDLLIYCLPAKFWLTDWLTLLQHLCLKGQFNAFMALPQSSCSSFFPYGIYQENEVTNARGMMQMKDYVLEVKIPFIIRIHHRHELKQHQHWD